MSLMIRSQYNQQSKMFNAPPQIHIGRINEQNKLEVYRLLTKKFIESNPVWHTFELNYDKVYNFFVQQVQMTLESVKKTAKIMNDPELDMNFAITYNNKIVTIGMHYQLHQFYSQIDTDQQKLALQEFSLIDALGRKMMQKIDYTKYPKNRHVYGTFYVNGDDYIEETRKYRMLFLLKAYVQYLYLKKNFLSMIFRTSNNKTKTIFCQIGAHVIESAQLQVKGQKFDIHILELDFKKFQQTAQALYEKTKANKKPKL